VPPVGLKYYPIVAITLFKNRRGMPRRWGIGLVIRLYALFVTLIFPLPLAAAETLREAAERDKLHVGVMPVDATWNTPQQKALVVREFNVVTVGAYWKRTHPARETYDWAVTDAVVNWADGAGLGVHLHPLVWADDRQNPQWLLDSTADPATARAILDEHIAAAMTRYRGVADVWDVVNEATANDGSGGYRDGWWLRALGPDYIVEAFRAARRHDPDAVLLYNDYAIELANAYQTGRWQRTQEILTTLKAENLVDGLGWQLHVTPEQALGADFALDERMAWVEQQGLKNFVTELDVAIPAGDEALAQQAQAYRRVAETWLDHHNGGWFQVWGVYDKFTWLGADKRPLLFDANYAPKPAYHELLDTIDRATSADFNRDGVVNGGDFLEWQRRAGVDLDDADLQRWREQFPADPPPDPPSASVPEPAANTWLLTLVALRRTRHFRNMKYAAPAMHSDAHK
jgi:endo-1,4-beta-xylanase